MDIYGIKTHYLQDHTVIQAATRTTSHISQHLTNVSSEKKILISHYRPIEKEKFKSH